MEFDRVHYVDTSVLVKLLVKEDGSDVLDEYMKEWYTSSFCITSLCFAEALGVLKLKRVKKKRPDHISEDTYFTGVDELRAYAATDRISLIDVGITDSVVFQEVETIARRHSLDVADAYQIVTVRRDYFSRFPEAQPILITADKKLAKAARAENLRVWEISNPPP